MLNFQNVPSHYPGTHTYVQHPYVWTGNLFSCASVCVCVCVCPCTCIFFGQLVESGKYFRFLDRSCVHISWAFRAWNFVHAYDYSF